MSELVRDYMAHFFDKTKFVKKNQGENIDELNLTMNPTSLLEKDMASKQKRLQQMAQDRFKQDSILSSNRSATADFLNPPAGKNNPYG